LREKPYTNLDGTTPDKSLGDLWRWMVLDRVAGRRPRHARFETPRRENDGAAMAAMTPHLTWIGHATFVMRLGGKLVATDPIWSERISGTARRNVAPGVAFEDVPKLDVVTVSHSHYDHMDLPTLRRIHAANPSCLFVVPRDNGEILRGAGIDRVVELDWWQSHAEGALEITHVPAQHWSLRVPWDRNKRLWGGFVYESSEGTAYHAGDTAWSERVFREIAARFPAIDWAMIPIGAYEPVWFMGAQHIGPEDAARAWEILGAKTLVAMHWGTFKLTDEPLGEPPERVRAWMGARGMSERLWVMDIGETRPLSPRG
jgi:L-ascorbate metabolism protein UlaG (beta-lactamase superfamily)